MKKKKLKWKHVKNVGYWRSKPRKFTINKKLSGVSIIKGIQKFSYVLSSDSGHVSDFRNLKSAKKVAKLIWFG